MELKTDQHQNLLLTTLNSTLSIQPESKKQISAPTISVRIPLLLTTTKVKTLELTKACSAAMHSGLNRCSVTYAHSLTSTLPDGDAPLSKKRQGSEDDLAELIFQRSKKLKSTEPDEIYGVLNFMYLSPKARFFSTALDDIRRLNNDAYIKSYGLPPSSSEYKWNEPTNYYLKTGTLNGAAVTCRTVDWFTVYICTELKGQPGIPPILGYEKIQWNSYVVLKEYSADPPQSLSVKQMAEQLLQALHNFHRQGLVNTNLRPSCIEWDGGSIIIPLWHRCLFRGDCHDYNYRKKGFDAAQPMKDLRCAGKLIQKWAIERDCVSQFEELVNALINPNAFKRITALQALDMLNGRPIQWPRYLENDSIFVQYSYQHVIAEFTTRFENELRSTYDATTSDLDECQWHTEASKNRKTSLKFGTRLGQNVFAKIRYGPVEQIAKEYYITKMMSGKSPHFPTVIATKAHTSQKGKAGFTIVMPEYQIAPKVKSLRKTFNELLSALDALRQHGIVHNDIAPQNIMWNSDDELILIDFGSAFMVNHKNMGPDPLYGGHRGFMASDRVPTLASDIYSVGKVMVHFMNQWRMRDNELIDILQRMIKAKWYKRPALEEIIEMLK